MFNLNSSEIKSLIIEQYEILQKVAQKYEEKGRWEGLAQDFCSSFDGKSILFVGDSISVYQVA